MGISKGKMNTVIKLVNVLALTVKCVFMSADIVPGVSGRNAFPFE